MASITLDVQKPFGPGVWLAKLEPEAEALITTGKGMHGARTVIGVREHKFDPAASTLTVPLACLTTLVRGASGSCLLIDIQNDYADDEKVPGWKLPSAIKLASTDESLVDLCGRELGSPLASAARDLVAYIRNLDRGGRFKETDRGKFVNRENNFVTLRVQPRKKDILVTLYGNPELYELAEEVSNSGLELKQDQNGYTRFNWGRAEQLEAVESLVQMAHWNKLHRANRG